MQPPSARPWVIAHRGASAVCRENTLAAFRAAAEMGADGVELDVRRTADGVPVVHHDARLPGVGPLVALPAEELRRLAPWLPTLEEALAACAGLWVDVEVKNSPADPDWDPGDTLVEQVAARLAAWGGEAWLTSFNPATLARARRLSPSLPTGLLVDRPAPTEAVIQRAAGMGHRAVLPRAAGLGGETGTALVEAAHRAGLLVVAWTVDDPGEVRRLARAGVDGLITNRPDAALSALGQHHHRHRG